MGFIKKTVTNSNCLAKKTYSWQIMLNSIKIRLKLIVRGKIMEETAIQEIFNKLASGELMEHQVNKEDFIHFRNVLVKRKDFKHFRGIALRGGGVLYRYTEEPRT